VNTSHRVPEVDAKTTYEQFQSGEIRLLDVREPSEWALGHIDGAALVPMSELGRRWRELDTSVKWVCVCRSGSRSEYATALLRQAGLDIANMAGGMLDWQANKLPITAPGIVESHRFFQA
jgi:rhodanese-related sulfurtransferase